MKYILFLFLVVAATGKVSGQPPLYLGAEVQGHYLRFFEVPDISLTSGNNYELGGGLSGFYALNSGWRLYFGLTGAMVHQKLYQSGNRFIFTGVPLLIQWQKPVKNLRGNFFLRSGIRTEYLARVTHRYGGGNVEITRYTRPFYFSGIVAAGYGSKMKNQKEWAIYVGARSTIGGSFPQYTGNSAGPSFGMGSVFLAVANYLPVKKKQE
ncbi:MAG: hypothetical protein R3C61_21480 [Bacteroidia bacterium]